jgi:hypothetical protein
VICQGAETGIKASGAKGMIYGIEIKNSTLFYTKKDKEIVPTAHQARQREVCHLCPTLTAVHPQYSEYLRQVPGYPQTRQ